MRAEDQPKRDAEELNGLGPDGLKTRTSSFESKFLGPASAAEKLGEKNGTELEPEVETSITALPTTNCDRSQELIAAPALQSRGIKCHCESLLDADLRGVVEAWAELSDEIRKAILSLAQLANQNKSG
jgi:hypothetical protein